MARYADRWARLKYDLVYGGASAAIVCVSSYILSLLSDGTFPYIQVDGTFPYILAIMTLFSCALILNHVRAIGPAHAGARLLIVVVISTAFFAMLRAMF